MHAQTPPAGPEPLRVLVAEDDPTALAVVVAFLQREHHVVFAATDGQAALDLASRRRFDVAVVDLEMPRLRGEVVIQQLRLRHPQIGIVAMTGLDSTQHLARCIDCGADQFVSKPIAPAAVLERAMRESLAPRRHASKLLHLLRRASPGEPNAEGAETP